MRTYRFFFLSIICVLFGLFLVSCNNPTTGNEEVFVSTKKTISANFETLGINPTIVSSNDNSIATANLENNLITITSISKGSVIITAIENEKAASILVTVSNSGSIDIKITKYENPFKSQNITIFANLEILGINPTNVSSDDQSIALVSLDNGEINITSKSEGNTTIIATDGNHSASILVKISYLGDISYEITKYSPKLVQVTFKVESNGKFDDTNSDTKIITGIAGDPLTEIPSVTANPGYEFIWWSQEIPTVFPDEDTTYTAYFSEATYTITYHLNGGSDNGNNPTEFIWGTQSILLTPPTKVGYTFSGWSYSNQGVSSSMTEKVYVNNMNYIEDGNLNIYALWKPNTYYIIFGNHSSVGGYYAKVSYNSNNLTFYKYMYTSTAADATKYSNVEYKYIPLSDENYDGWKIVCINSEEDIWNDLETNDQVKLLDNNAQLLKNIENITDENGNWISTSNYEVKSISK